MFDAESIDARQQHANHALCVGYELVVAYFKVPESVRVLVVAVEGAHTAKIVLQDGVLEGDVDAADGTQLHTRHQVVHLVARLPDQRVVFGRLRQAVQLVNCQVV